MKSGHDSRRRSASNRVGRGRPLSAGSHGRFERLEPRQLLAADPLFRINAGGPELTATPVWAEDSSANPSPFSNFDPGASTSSVFGTANPIDLSHASIPAGTPEAVFQSQRFDRPNVPNLEWDFPVAAGDYEVRLYFAEIFSGAFIVGEREFDVEIEGVTVLDGYDVFAQVGAEAGIVETFMVTSDTNLDIDFLRNPGKNDPIVMGIEILPITATTASSYFAVAPGGMIGGASTFKNGSFVLQNTSSGGEQIDSVVIDLSTGFLLDMVYDPFGDAGDDSAKPFTPNTGVAETGQSSFNYLTPHDDGFDGLEILFDDFDPGEEFTFAIDVDPTSIRGSSQPGPGQSGSVSGLELTGATVTVNYSDGATQVGDLFPVDGSEVDAEATLQDVAPAAPTIELLGAPAAPAILPSAAQTLRVTGAPGSAVRVFQAESGLFLASPPFDIDPFETNKALAVTHFNDTVGPGGFVDIPVTLGDSQTQGGVNHFLAVVEDAGGVPGRVSDSILVALNDLPPGSVPVVDDTDGPTTSTVVVNPVAAEDGPVVVSASIADTLSDVTAAEYFIDTLGAEGSGTPLGALDGSFDSMSESVVGAIGAVDFDALAAGGHTLFVRGQDAVGNWGAAATAAFDKLEAPIVTSVVATPALSAVTPVTITATIGDSFDTVIAAEFFIDTVGAEGAGTSLGAVDGVFDSTTEDVTAVIDAGVFDALALGEHTVFVRGQDALGAWGEVASTTFIKQDLPQTTNVVVTPDSSVLGPATVTADIADASDNVVAAEFFLDAVGAEGTGTPLSPADGAFDSASEAATGLIDTATFDGLAPGVHTVFVRGQDSVGLWGEVASQTFIKQDIPVVSLVVVTPSAPSVGPVIVSATVADTDSDIAAAEFFVDTLGLTGEGIPLVSADGAYDSPGEVVVGAISAAALNSLAVGQHTVFVRAQDADANWGDAVSTTFEKIIGLAGDFDGSGAVDQLDYDLWAQTLGSTTDLRADGNGNGRVDVGDFTVWRDNEGQSLDPPPAFGLAVGDEADTPIYGGPSGPIAAYSPDRAPTSASDNAFAELANSSDGSRLALLLIDSGSTALGRDVESPDEPLADEEPEAEAPLASAIVDLPL